MITGSVVNVPCPISAAGDTMVMVPSVAIVSQTFGDSAALGLAAPDGFDAQDRQRIGRNA